MEALHLQTPLMKAMTRSDALQAFTLAEIGSPFTEAEYSDPRLSTYTKGAEVVEALGLKDKFTTITSGDYPDYFFGYKCVCTSGTGWSLTTQLVRCEPEREFGEAIR
jgi:hypothetical protein